jgi:hypothetical protein
MTRGMWPTEAELTEETEVNFKHDEGKNVMRTYKNIRSYN